MKLMPAKTPKNPLGFWPKTYPLFHGSIKYRLLFFLILFALVPLIILGAVSYSISKRTIDHKVRDYSERLIIQTTENMDFRLSAYKDTRIKDSIHVDRTKQVAFSEIQKKTLQNEAMVKEKFFEDLAMGVVAQAENFQEDLRQLGIEYLDEEVQHDLEQQTAVKSIYYLTKTLDKTRPVIDNDGWEHTDTDICTIHDYEQDGEKLSEVYSNQDRVLAVAPSTMFPRYVFARGYRYKNQPVLISEFGGIAFSGVEGWVYGSGVKNEEEFTQRVTGLFQAIQKNQYLCGYCYTQLTDVEHEKNGLLTFERKPKISPEIIKGLNTF